MPPTNTRDTMERQTPGGIVLPLPSPLLGMLPPELQPLPMKVFWANFPLFSLAASPAAGASQTQTYQNPPNYWLAAWFGTASLRSSDEQTDRSSSPVVISNFTDNANTLYQTQGTQADIRNFFGVQGISQPAVWAQPLMLIPNGALNLTLQSLDTANALHARITMMGVLIGPTNLVQLKSWAPPA